MSEADGAIPAGWEWHHFALDNRTKGYELRRIQGSTHPAPSGEFESFLLHLAFRQGVDDLISACQGPEAWLLPGRFKDTNLAVVGKVRQFPSADPTDRRGAARVDFLVVVVPDGASPPDLMIDVAEGLFSGEVPVADVSRFLAKTEQPTRGEIDLDLASRIAGLAMAALIADARIPVDVQFSSQVPPGTALAWLWRLCPPGLRFRLRLVAASAPRTEGHQLAAFLTPHVWLDIRDEAIGDASLCDSRKDPLPEIVQNWLSIAVGLLEEGGGTAVLFARVQENAAVTFMNPGRFSRWWRLAQRCASADRSEQGHRRLRLALDALDRLLNKPPLPDAPQLPDLMAKLEQLLPESQDAIDGLRFLTPIAEPSTPPPSTVPEHDRPASPSDRPMTGIRTLGSRGSEWLRGTADGARARCIGRVLVGLLLLAVLALQVADWQRDRQFSQAQETAVRAIQAACTGGEDIGGARDERDDEIAVPRIQRETHGQQDRTEDASDNEVTSQDAPHGGDAGSRGSADTATDASSGVQVPAAIEFSGGPHSATQSEFSASDPARSAGAGSAAPGLPTALPDELAATVGDCGVLGAMLKAALDEATSQPRLDSWLGCYFRATKAGPATRRQAKPSAACTATLSDPTRRNHLIRLFDYYCGRCPCGR